MSNKKEAYLCLSAMLRAREPRLLDLDRAQRMLDAPSFEEAAKLLTDCGYADMSQMSAGEIEAALSRRRSEIFNELADRAPDREPVELFRMKYDYHNLKTLIKAEAMGQEPMRLMSASGRVEPERLRELYHEGRYGEMPGLMGPSAKEAKELLGRTANPQLADFVLDRAYYTELKDTAKSMQSGFLQGYAALLIDCGNLKSAVRTLRMGKSREFLAQALIPGGSVSEDRIAAAGDREALSALYLHSPLESAAALGAEAAVGGAMTAFERACDNAVNSYLKQAKLISYGSEPLVAYLAAVEGEITAVRMILTGRLSGIDAQVIRERLRDLYA